MTMRRRAIPVVALAVAAIAATPSLAATKGVDVKDDFFKPHNVTIVKGTKVVWTWRGQGRHNVVVAQGPSTFRSEIKRTGTYSHRFKRTGTWQITCTVHPGMNMKVVSKKPS
jgi:plastocyanin